MFIFVPYRTHAYHTQAIRVYNPRLMCIQHHQRERLSTATAALSTAVLLAVHSGWLGGWVSYGSVTCVAVPTKKIEKMPNLRSNRQLKPPIPLNFSYRIFRHSALAPNFSINP